MFLQAVLQYIISGSCYDTHTHINTHTRARAHTHTHTPHVLACIMFFITNCGKWKGWCYFERHNICTKFCEKSHLECKFSNRNKHRQRGDPVRMISVFNKERSIKEWVWVLQDLWLSRLLYSAIRCQVRWLKDTENYFTLTTEAGYSSETLVLSSQAPSTPGRR
jgi:hypothetical protein